MAIRERSKRSQLVTKQLVSEFVSMTKTEVDRPLSDSRLAELEEELQAGKFTTTPVWACVTCKQDKTTYRLNGKHTSTLLSRIDGALPKIVVMVERFECDTIEEVASLFCRYDRRLCVRTQRDINRIFSFAENLQCIPAKIIDNAVTGMNYSEYRNPGGTQEDRARTLVENREFVVWVNRVLHGTCEESLHLIRGPVFAAMFMTWQKDQKAAAEFWSLVRNGAGAPGTPAKKLERMLLTTGVGFGKGYKHEKAKKMQGREMTIRCIHAWNAWRQNKNTDLKYYADADFPEVK